MKIYIFLDYVHNRISIEDASKGFLKNPVEKWDVIGKEGFFYALDNKINEWTGWNYVYNERGGFLGLWWHFIRCKDKDFEYYLQIQNVDLFIRIMLKEKNEKTKEKRNEAIVILDNVLTEDEKKYIKKPRTLRPGKSMAIKQVEQNAWLIKNNDGIVDIDKTAERLKYFSSLLDRCK